MLRRMRSCRGRTSWAAVLLWTAACGSTAAGPPPASPGSLDGSDTDGAPGIDAGDDGPATTADAGDAGASALHVVGNHLVKEGSVVRLLGVDHSGTEYACIGGYA